MNNFSLSRGHHPPSFYHQGQGVDQRSQKWHSHPTENPRVSAVAKRNFHDRSLNSYGGKTRTFGKEFKSDRRLVSFNELITKYGRERNLEAAFKIFDNIPGDLNPDVYTYTSLINACIRAKDFDRAFSVFDRMVEAKVQPNEVTYTSLINACIRAKDFNRAFSIFDQMIEAKVHPDEVTYNTLINACVRAKDFNRAFSIFDQMVKAKVYPGELIYTSLINACIRAKDVGGAFSIFNQMVKAKRVHVGSAAHISLINACIHARDVEEASQGNASPSPCEYLSKRSWSYLEMKRKRHNRKKTENPHGLSQTRSSDKEQPKRGSLKQ